eukprot:scaffold492_cov347-Prasinococcus_capsulatus_cf.AAC.3
MMMPTALRRCRASYEARVRVRPCSLQSPPRGLLALWLVERTGGRRGWRAIASTTHRAQQHLVPTDRAKVPTPRLHGLGRPTPLKKPGPVVTTVHPPIRDGSAGTCLPILMPGAGAPKLAVRCKHTNTAVECASVTVP